MAPPLQSRPVLRTSLPGLLSKAKSTTLTETLSRIPPSIAPYTRHISWSPTGTYLAATSSVTNSLIRIWNPEKPNVRATTELRGHVGVVEKVGWMPWRENILSSTGADGMVRLWDVRAGGGKGAMVKEIKVGDYGLGMAWKPDGLELAITLRDDSIVGIDIRTDEVMTTSVDISANVEESMEMGLRDGKRLNLGHINQVTFHNSGKYIFVTTEDGPVRILEWPTMKEIYALRGHTSSSNCVSHSPNGMYIATGGSDSLICLWNTTDWICRNTLANSTSAIQNLSFSFDGTYIASGCGAEKDGQNVLEIAHVETGEYIHSISTPATPTIVAWHPLHYWLAYAGDPSGIKLLGFGNSSL